MKHSEERRQQWRNYYKKNSYSIRHNIEERREYNRKANRRLLAQVGSKVGCSECKGRFNVLAEVKWYYNTSCSYFGALLSSNLKTVRFFEQFTPKWGRFFCDQCFKSYISTIGTTKRRAYSLSLNSDE